MRKPSELTTDECADVLCELTPYIVNIVSDKEIMNAVGKAVDKKTITQVGIMLLGAQKITAIIPLLLKTHRSDIYAILSIVGEKSVEEIAVQNIMTTMWQTKELLNDKELVSFFKSWAHGEENE